MDKAEADAELTRLYRAERAHHRNQDALRYKIKSIERRIEELAAVSSTTQAAIARRVDTRGEAFTMVVGDGRYGKRQEAGQWLKQLLGRQMAKVSGDGWPGPLVERHGQLAGFEVVGTARRVLGTAEVTVALDGVPESGIWLGQAELEDIDPARLIVRLENRLHSLESIQAKTSSEIDRLKIEAARATEDLAKPFPLSEQLADARNRVVQIEERLEEAARLSARGDAVRQTEGVQDHDRDTTDPGPANGQVTVAPQGQAQPAVAVASCGFPAGQVVVAHRSGSAPVTRLAAGPKPGPSRVR